MGAAGLEPANLTDVNPKNGNHDRNVIPLEHNIESKSSTQLNIEKAG